MLAAATIDIRPSIILGNGRYLLDEDGRLHPERFRALVRPVAAVVVTMKASVALPIVEEKPAPAATTIERKAPLPPTGDRIAPMPAPAPAPKKASKPKLVRTVKPQVTVQDVFEREDRAPATRAQAIRVAAKLDTKAFAAAARARAAAPKPVKKIEAPVEHAKSPDPCRKCGANGRRGCEHQLPFLGYDA